MWLQQYPTDFYPILKRIFKGTPDPFSLTPQIPLHRFLNPYLTQYYYQFQDQIEQKLSCSPSLKTLNPAELDPFLDWVQKNVKDGPVLLFFKRTFMELVLLYNFWVETPECEIPLIFKKKKQNKKGSQFKTKDTSVE